MNHEKTIKRIQELVPSMVEYYKDSLYVPVREGAGKDAYYEVYDFIDENMQYVPITLAVALMAILKHNEPDSEEQGLKLESDIVSLVKGHFGYKGWNLSKDNFNDQSEETKTFIGVLLGNNSQEE